MDSGTINNKGEGKKVYMRTPKASISQMPSPAGQVIHRYESYEHAKFGNVESLIGAEEKKYFVKVVEYVVLRKEMPKDIAAKFGVSSEFLLARNPKLVKTWTTPKGRKIRGFNAGEKIIIPGPTISQVAARFGLSEEEILTRNAAAAKTWTDKKSKKSFQGFDRGVRIIIRTGKLAVKGKGAAPKTGVGTRREKTVTINGIRFKYGEIIALGDFYAKPSDMFKAKRSELKKLRSLIRKEAKDPSSVGTEEWQAATKDRYLKLAEKNVTHFAPSNKALTRPTKTSGRNHKTEWQKHHHKALKAAKKGHMNKALATNAFGDHFLTDAFSAGHLINKEDVMNRFEKVFTSSAQKKFFEEVARQAWKDKKVSSSFSKLETYDPIKGWWNIFNWNPNINSASRFASLLQEIYNDKEGKKTILNTVPKIIHDSLNKSGVEVANRNGDKWTRRLTGDGKLNAETLAIGKKAVAQSQVNVLNNKNMTGTPDYIALFKKVWDYVPYPTKKGVDRIKKVLKKMTDPAHKLTLKKAAELIKKQAATIIKELKERKKLKVA